MKSFFQIRNDKSVRGFKIGNTEVKLTAFADDTTFFVKDEASLRRILKIMSVYSKYSSLRANCGKCEASWIGGSKTSDEKPVNCRWGVKYSIQKNGENKAASKILPLL